MPFTAIGVDLGVGTALAGAVGETAAGIGTGVAEGAALGAGSSAITGGNPLTGALTGGFTGGVLGSGIGGAIGDATGLGATAGNVIAGGGAGAIGSAITGGNIGLGAISGGAGGLLTSSLGAGAPSAAPEVAGPSAATGPMGGAIGAPPAIAAASPDQFLGAPETTGGASPTQTTTPISGVPTTNIFASGTGAGGGVIGDAAIASGGGGMTGDQLTAYNLNPGTSAGAMMTSPAPAGDAGAAMAGEAGIKPEAPGMLSGAGNFLSKNWPLVAGAGIIGYEALTGNQPLPAEGAIQNMAGTNAAAGRSLESYIQTGKLPPGLQQGVDAATKANEAGIRSTFARMGMSGSTSEAQALAGVKNQAAAATAKIATDLFAQGLSLTNLSEHEFTTLLNVQMQQEATLNANLGRFAAALAGAKMTAT